MSALVRDGVSLEDLDKAMKNFGMPVGPITLADEVGIDVTSHVAKFLSNADLGTRMDGGDISLMENMIEKGWLGKKAGQGFYTYSGKKKTINSEIKSYVKEFVERDLGLKEKEIQDRIVCRYVLQCRVSPVSDAHFLRKCFLGSLMRRPSAWRTRLSRTPSLGTLVLFLERALLLFEAAHSVTLTRLEQVTTLP